VAEGTGRGQGGGTAKEVRKDLDPVRERDDFMKLLAEVETTKDTKKE
jgi:hypothetical protein